MLLELPVRKTFLTWCGCAKGLRVVASLQPPRRDSIEPRRALQCSGCRRDRTDGIAFSREPAGRSDISDFRDTSPSRKSRLLVRSISKFTLAALAGEGPSNPPKSQKISWRLFLRNPLIIVGRPAQASSAACLALRHVTAMAFEANSEGLHHPRQLGPGIRAQIKTQPLTLKPPSKHSPTKPQRSFFVGRCALI